VSRLLVVNADDFGLSPGVNAGIAAAHAAGIVTSASLMVRAPAAVAAAELAASLPRLGVGLHVDLAESVCEDGDWRCVYEVVDCADPHAVAAELERQLDRFRALTGRAPTHLDTHQHVHRSEPVRSIMGVRARELRLPLRHHGAVRYCGAFYGQDHGGAPLPDAIGADALARLIGALPEGATELACHPAASVPPGAAYGRERVAELAALVDPRVRAAIARAGVRLCTFPEVRAALRPAAGAGSAASRAVPVR
jgi:predicted glycoside hydrolase/deacetylase ChbG (UPF0249 family)